MQIRIPVIPLYNDSFEMFAEYGLFISSLGKSVTTVQLLPYHSLGITKWERLGRTPDLSKDDEVVEFSVPSDETMQKRKAQLESYGLPVTIH